MLLIENPIPSSEKFITKFLASFTSSFPALPSDASANWFSGSPTKATKLIQPGVVASILARSFSFSRSTKALTSTAIEQNSCSSRCAASMPLATIDLSLQGIYGIVSIQFRTCIGLREKSALLHGHANPLRSHPHSVTTTVNTWQYFFNTCFTSSVPARSGLSRNGNDRPVSGLLSHPARRAPPGAWTRLRVHALPPHPCPATGFHAHC